jgi:catalase (peroxidase I)
MAQTESPAERWAAYLGAALRERGWQQRDLIAASNNQLRSGTLSKWMNGKGPANAVWAVRVARWLGADETEALRAAGRDELLKDGDVATRVPDAAAPDKRDDDAAFIAKLRSSSDPEMHKLADRFEEDLERIRRVNRIEFEELQRRRQAQSSDVANMDTGVNRSA